MPVAGETRENPPIKGAYFSLANPWKFYFVNEAGESVVKLKAGAVLPTTAINPSETFQPAVVPDDYDEANDYYFYNGNRNSLAYDAEKGLYYWMTSIPGNEYVTSNEFYVHFNRNDVDTIRVKFKFIHEGVIGGDTAAEVLELYYNGILAIKNDDYVTGEEVYIRK